MRKNGVFVWLALCLGSGGTAYGADEADAAKNDDDHFIVVRYINYECPQFEGKSVPGNSKEHPLEKDIYDVNLYGDKLDCRWIKVRGYLRSTSYYHYRSLLFPSVSGFYKPEPDLKADRFIIESYAEGTPSRWELHGAELEVIGRFYDLCAHAQREQKERNESWAMILGPCHYGPAIMLSNVSIVRRLSAPYRRVTGERNRNLIGTLAKAPENWPDRDMIRRQAFAWLKAARKGRRALEEFVYGPDVRAGAEKEPNDPDLPYDVRDPDSRIAFLTTSPKSPLRKLRGAPERIPFRIFLLNLSDRTGGWNRAFGCFCLHRTCRDVWPLFEEDPDDMLNDYICTEHVVSNGKWKAVW